MLNIRIALLSVAFLVLFTLTSGLMPVRPEVVLDPSSELASVLDNQERSANQNKVNNTRSYRSPLDECFDVSLSELASCRNTGKAPTQVDRSTVDACANLPPNGPVSCTNARPALVRLNRSPVDTCTNLPPNGPVSCTNARPALTRLNRSPVDACANLPPNGPVSCTNARLAQAP